MEILYKINEYLNGLDNIIMYAREEEELREEAFCNFPNYGHFLVVINKMMGEASDEELYIELMTPEPGFHGKHHPGEISDSEECISRRGGAELHHASSPHLEKYLLREFPPQNYPLFLS